MSENLFGPAVGVLTKSLEFLEARHRIIANNIANAGTPSYKAKRAPVAEFQKALAAAVEAHRKRPNARFEIRSTRHISDNRAGLDVEPLAGAGAVTGILQHDGNNVNLETEINALAQNTLMHGVLSHLLRKQFMLLKSAIAERVDV